MPKHKAIFLDRDGVINIDTGYAYLPEQIEFIGGVFDFCRHAHGLGYKLIVVTNQSGIGRGLYNEDQFHALMRWMQERFVEESCPLTAYYYCPHHPQHGIGAYKRDCDCRKPKPGMIAQAARDWDIDLSQSMLVGDHARDIEAARAGGIARQELFTAWDKVLL